MGRMILEASRTLLVWSFGLAVHYYYDPNSPFGEVLTAYSPLALFGFALVMSGQAIYGEVVKLPGLTYPSAHMTKSESSSGSGSESESSGSEARMQLTLSFGDPSQTEQPLPRGDTF